MAMLLSCTGWGCWMHMRHTSLPAGNDGAGSHRLHYPPDPLLLCLSRPPALPCVLPARAAPSGSWAGGSSCTSGHRVSHQGLFMRAACDQARSARVHVVQDSRSDVGHCRRKNLYEGKRLPPSVRWRCSRQEQVAASSSWCSGPKVGCLQVSRPSALARLLWMEEL